MSEGFKMNKSIVIDGQSLTMDIVNEVAYSPDVKVELAEIAKANMLKSKNFISKKINAGETIYGVNTGFGVFAETKISPEQIEQLQTNILRSHCCGIGAPFTKEESRAIMLLRANTIARGHSGVRIEVVERLLHHLNADVIPVIPSQGSVGACGDLAPLAHLAITLIGEGHVWGSDGSIEPADKILNLKKIKPLKLEAKEGLALINGCQVMTGVGLLAAHKAKELIQVSDIAASMSLEALRGTRSSYDPIIFKTRAHRGEAATAENLNAILGDESAISKSHEDCGKVQDPYSLRCVPAVHGAVKDVLLQTVKTLTIESNSSTDNPLVFADDDKILSCGNFHGQPVSFALDFLAIALCSLGNISERRIEKLTKPQLSGLPMHLIKDGGLNSGMMMVQVAAASLASENKGHAHPASVDSISTNVDKEDHVSMGTIAAVKLRRVVENVANILAMEILCAQQALYLLEPLQPAAGVKVSKDLAAKVIPKVVQDRFFQTDIFNVRKLIDNGSMLNAVSKAVGGLKW